MPRNCAQWCPVVSIQSRFDTSRFETNRSRFDTHVKSFRYTSKVDSIQTEIDSIQTEVNSIQTLSRFRSKGKLEEIS